MTLIRIFCFSFDDKEKADKAFAIRRKVFVEEQHVDPDLEYDEFEPSSNHYLLFENDTPVATARWRITSSGIKLERFAVLPDYRGKNYGKQILERILRDVIPFGKEIYLNAQAHVVDFYGKYHFTLAGDRFMEANIPHYRMIYKRPLR